MIPSLSGVIYILVNCFIDILEQRFLCQPISLIIKVDASYNAWSNSGSLSAGLFFISISFFPSVILVKPFFSFYFLYVLYNTYTA